MKFYIPALAFALSLLAFSTKAGAQLSNGIVTNTKGVDVTPATETVATPDAWQKRNIKLTFYGSGVQRDSRGQAYYAEAIYSGDETTAGNLAFTCYTGKLSASFALDPVDLGPLFANPANSRRLKNRRPVVLIDGEQVSSKDWIWMPKMKVYRARRRASTIQLYKAVLRGSTVEMQDRGETVRLNIPAADATFKNFGAGCGVGLGALKK